MGNALAKYQAGDPLAALEIFFVCHVLNEAVVCDTTCVV